MLLAFVEEMGHEYESLLDGAMEDTNTSDEHEHEKPDPTALAVANEAIAESLRRCKEGVEDEEEIEEDDEEDEDEDEEAEYYRWGKNVIE